jgi:peptidoglycan hydrolase CwlO-like protein
MNEIKKSVQDMKGEINKDMETLKSSQSEINNSISQINIISESLVNRMEHVESRVTGQKTK